MNKEELQALGVSEEVTAKLLEKMKDFIPKSRFDEVNNAKKKAEEQVAERDKQLEQLSKSTETAEGLKAEIERLKTENETTAAKAAAEMKAFKVETAIDKALAAAGAKNVKAVKALLSDIATAELDGDEVKGLAEQIKTLQADENSKFLFSEQSNSGSIVGVNVGESGGVGAGNNDFAVRLAAARQASNMQEAIKIKREAAAEGVYLV